MPILKIARFESIQKTNTTEKTGVFVFFSAHKFFRQQLISFEQLK
jgi:hypothetical protein